MDAATSPAVSLATPLHRDTTFTWSRYATTAVAAVASDLVTKEVATRALSDGHMVPLSDRVALMLMYNTGTAGGFSIGPFTFALNVIVTLAAILMVLKIVKPLSAIDPRTNVALGLVTGGAMGNLLSMIAGPAGVADFFAINIGSGTTVVMNLADLLLWTGAALLIPVVARLIHLTRLERAAR